MTLDLFAQFEISKRRFRLRGVGHLDHNHCTFRVAQGFLQLRQTVSVTYMQIETRVLVYVALGSLAIALLAAFLIAPLNAMKARGSARLPIRSLGRKPVLQIELAWSDADLMKIFSPGDIEANLRDAKAGNNLDTFLFIPSYSCLLIALGLLLSRFTRFSSPKLLLIIVLLVPIIAICDWSENFGIARAIEHIEAHRSPNDGDAVKISCPSLMKWILTVVVLGAFGIEAFYTNSWKWFPLATAFVLLSLRIASVLCFYARERWS